MRRPLFPHVAAPRSASRSCASSSRAGDCAIGLLFAFGGFAIAPISIGGCAIGLVPWGGAAFGVLAAGGLSVGVWSFGGLAIGWQSLGGCALGWSAAVGGVALARDFALGGIAHAAQVNNGLAEQFINSMPFFHYGELTTRYMAWLNLIWIIPLLCWWWVIIRAKRAELKPAA